MRDSVNYESIEKYLNANTILLCIFLYPYTLFPNVVVFDLFLFWFQRFVESKFFCLCINILSLLLWLLSWSLIIILLSFCYFISCSIFLSLKVAVLSIVMCKFNFILSVLNPVLRQRGYSRSTEVKIRNACDTTKLTRSVQVLFKNVLLRWWGPQAQDEVVFKPWETWFEYIKVNFIEFTNTRAKSFSWSI